jgi:hypothetical protein
VLALLPLILTPLLPARAAQEPPPARVPQAAIDEAIDRGVRFLLGSQNPDGTWGPPRNPRPGRTALMVYALLKSGVDPDLEPLRRALTRLSLEDPAQTYDTALLAMVLATLEDVEYVEWLEVLAANLVGWQLRHGDWSYPQGDGDLSNTQYAALGLWAALRSGVEVPVDAWNELQRGVQRYASREGGFGYSRGARGVSESMTAAGVATLAICAAGLRATGALQPADERRLERAEERGVEWLAARFDDAISARQGGWPFYKLYGIERVGGLLGIEKLGEHEWYPEGARRILAVQNPDGSWGGWAGAGGRPGASPRGGDPWIDVRTAFALLFLRRATSRTGTGEGSTGKRTVFGTTSAADDVQVRVTGQDPLTIWITGWGPALRERFEWPREQGQGPHVARVEVLVDGAIVAAVEGDPRRPAGLERFALQHSLPRSGTYAMQVRAHVHAAPAEGSQEPGPAAVVASPAFQVEVRDVVPQWLRDQVAERPRNLLPSGEPRVSVSTALREGGASHAPERAVDGRYLTCWLAAADDEQPRLTIVLGRPREADVILLGSARTVPHRAGHYARPMEVEVTVNEDETYRVLMPPDERRKARLELPAPVRVKQLDLVIRWKAPGEVASTGLSEVELQRRD